MTDKKLAAMIRQSHETERGHEHKAAAKARGRGGRWRGKNGARENNKARGGKMAR